MARSRSLRRTTRLSAAGCVRAAIWPGLARSSPVVSTTALGAHFETRARMSNNAAGLLFSGSLHNAFDWDGSAHVDLMPSSVANVAVYECAKDAIMSAGGDATIELTST